MTLYGGIFDFAQKEERLTEVERELQEPSVWDQPERAQSLGRERADLEKVVVVMRTLDAAIQDAEELLELADAESDSEAVSAVEQDVAGLEEQLAALEFRRMFSGDMDSAGAFIDIQAGSGGTEAQD